MLLKTKMQVIRRYSTQAELPLVSKKITPVEYRANATELIKNNLDRWIKENDVTSVSQNKTEVFTRLYQNPIRQRIPDKPQEMMTIRFNQIEDSKKAEYVNYFKDLVRFSYPNKFRKLYEEVKTVWKKYKTYPEVKNEFFYFHVKKSNSQVINKMEKNEYFFKTPATYMSLLDGIEIAKNSNRSLAELVQVTNRLLKYKIPVSSELLYRLYYTIPKQCRAPIKEIYTPSDIEYNYPRLFDEWKDALINKKVPFSFATYIQFTNAMVDEYRIQEGLNFLYKLVVFYKVEIPPSLAKYTTDKIVMKEPDLAIPASLFIQRFTGCQLKQYAAFKLTSNLVLSHRLTSETLELIKLLVKFNEEGKAKFVHKVNQRVADDPELRVAWEAEPNAELCKLWSTQYQANDNYFKPGFTLTDYAPIMELFPSNIKANIFIKELDELIIAGNKADIWTAKLSQVKQDKSVFIKGCNHVIDLLIKKNNYNEVAQFVELLKPEFDVSYVTYLKLIDSFIKTNNFERNELEFCTLLLFKLQLFHSSFIKEYLIKYPVLSKLLDASNKNENKKLLADRFDKYVNELKSGASFEKVMEAL